MNFASKLRVDALARVYLLAAALVTLAYGVMNLRIRSEFALGDWLINYSSGFVRRGLIGEAVFLLLYFHIPALKAVFVLQIAAYGVTWTLLWSLARNFAWDFWSFALWVSPATLAFPVLNPPGGYRKEILLYALLCGVLVMLRAKVEPLLVSLLLTVGIIALLLSHEASVLFLPYLLAPFLLAGASFKRMLRLSILPVVAAAAVMWAVLAHPGTVTQRNTICRSVLAETQGSDAGLCGGAIGAIGVTASSEHAIVLRTTQRFHAVPLYGVTALLSLIPLLLTLHERSSEGSHRRAARMIAGTVAVSACTALPLFYSAIDWGRWIAMHITCALLLLLFAYTPSHVSSVEPMTMDAVFPSGNRRPIAIAMLLAYTFLWTLPFYGGFPPRSGYVGLAKYLRSHRSKHQGTAGGVAAVRPEWMLDTIATGGRQR